MSSTIYFNPLYMERIWGGRGLEEKLSRALPEEKVIGESWEVVDRPEAQSIVEGGPYHGLSIHDLMQQRGPEIMGPDYDSSRPFPVLVKWLDCQKRLSLQVHPPVGVADKLEGEPKTENWYVADCDEGADILVGLKQGVTREAFEEALNKNELEPLVHKTTSKSGDSLFVWSGRIHAIGAGNFILEIQQNSDTTYRVYDWGRVGLDGTPRDLHVEESLESIEFEDFEPELLRDTRPGDTLADCNEFRIRKERISKNPPVVFADKTEPVLISIASGTISVAGGEPREFQKGDTFLVPYTGNFEVSSEDEAVVLITDHFV